MVWRIYLHPAFEEELAQLDCGVRAVLASIIDDIRTYGPHLGRPQVDTLSGSRHANMKELRFKAADGQWRVAFAFDPARRAVFLVAGDKTGRNQRRFYRNLIAIADRRFNDHLSSM
jgi:hypothetical protein